MRVLLLTPFSPLSVHDHAANDLALPLVKALSSKIELHVYAPGQRNGVMHSWQAGGVTYYRGSSVQQRRRDRLGRYPYGGRAHWSRQSTKEAVDLTRALNPDILHAEYWSAAEPLLKLRRLVRTSLTPHDIPGDGMVIPRSGQSIYRRCLDYHELTKTRRIVNALTTEIDSIVVFSETDMHKVQNARGTVNIIPPGLDAPTTTWSRGHSHLAVFGGAMWRLENEATAIYLAQQVMPLVRKSVPDAELRIFGARPSQAVRALGRQPGITITGEVADYDAEFRHAQVALAPSMVEAGILIKSLRAMAMGCPVVLNRASARPLTGLQPGTQALVGDSPSEIAEHIVGLMLDGARAQRIGNSARSFVSANYGWDRSATAYLAAFEKLATAGTQSAQRGSGRR